MPKRAFETAPILKEGPTRGRRLLVLTLLTLGVGYAYFFSGGGWNQATRFNLIRAVAEEGTLRIDSYHENTGDKAQRDGHYYCDKAPGISFLALPAVWTARLLLEAFNLDPTSHSALVFLAFLSAFIASALPSLGGALALFWLSRRCGASPAAAALGALAVGLGTPTFAYSILLWGHAAAGGFLIAGLAAGVFALQGSNVATEFRASLAAGGLLGTAVLVEYPAAGAVLLLCMALLLRAYGTGARALFWRMALGLGLGGLVPAAILFCYQYSAFGSPLALSYSKVQGFEGMQQGFFGVTFPRPRVLWEILFGSQRGLVLLAPCLIVAPFGFHRMLKRQRGSTERFVFTSALTVVAYYFLLNASYHYWNGGWSYGPRHVGPALPFLGLGIAAAAAGSRWLVQSTSFLTAISVCITLPALAVNPMPPEALSWPLLRLYVPGLLNGQLGQNARGYFDQNGVANFNLGELVGFEGAASLLPLVIFWGVLLAMALKRQPDPSPGPRLTLSSRSTTA